MIDYKVEEQEIDLLIIIPHYNRPQNISETLQCLINLCSRIEYRIIISDNGSSNNCYRDLISSIDWSLIDSSRITLRRLFTGTGDLGSHIKRLLKDGIPKSKFIWLLGDDDLPRGDLASLLTKIVSRYQNSLEQDLPIAIFSNKLLPLNQSVLDGAKIIDKSEGKQDSIVISLKDLSLKSNTTSAYYKSLVDLEITDSLVGLTFISNQIIPAVVFRQIFLRSGDSTIDYSSQPLQVLSYCAFHSHLQILPVPVDLVSIAVNRSKEEIRSFSPNEVFDMSVQNYIHVMPQIHFLEENKCDEDVINWFLLHQQDCVRLIQNTFKHYHNILDKHSILTRYSWLVKLANAYTKRYASTELVPAEKIQLSDLVWDAMPIGGASFYSHLSGHIHL